MPSITRMSVSTKPAMSTESPTRATDWTMVLPDELAAVRSAEENDAPAITVDGLPPFTDPADIARLNRAALAAPDAYGTGRIVPGDVFALDVPDRPPSIWGDGPRIAWTAGERLILFGPPFIITRAQIDEMIDIIDETLSVVEQRIESF